MNNLEDLSAYYHSRRRDISMRKILISTFSVIVILVSALPSLAQDAEGEKEFRTFFAKYERAVSGRDIDFLEQAMPSDYVRTGANGKMTDRSRMLKYFSQQRVKPTFKYVSLKHVNIKVRVVGNMALLTNDWIAETSSVEPLNTLTTTDKGRYTGVFEKRRGRWVVIAEHDSEQIHEDQWIVSSVTKAGQEYHELENRLNNGRPYAELETSGDITALERTLADEYTNTSLDGDIYTKAQDLENYRSSQIKIKSAVFLEQKVRSIDNSSAIETGKIRYVGTNAGKAFDITKRYTTTWAFYDGRWQITANHTSAGKP